MNSYFCLNKVCEDDEIEVYVEKMNFSVCTLKKEKCLYLKWSEKKNLSY